MSAAPRFASAEQRSPKLERVLAACRKLCPWLARGELRARHDREPHGGAGAEHLHGAAIRIARAILAPVHYKPHSAEEAARIADRAVGMLATGRARLGRAIVGAPAELAGDTALVLDLAAAVFDAVRAGHLDGDVAAIAAGALTKALRDRPRTLR